MQFQQGPEGGIHLSLSHSGAPKLSEALRVSICQQGCVLCAWSLSWECACGGDDGGLQRQENEAETEPRGKGGLDTDAQVQWEMPGDQPAADTMGLVPRRHLGYALPFLHEVSASSLAGHSFPECSC